MLDYKFVVDNLNAVQANIKNRFMQADAQGLVRLYNRRTELTTGLQLLQQKRNANAASMKEKGANRNALIAEGKKLKEEIAAAEKELDSVEKELALEAKKIPNMAHPDAPVGKEDKDNLEIKRVGELPRFNFEPVDHVKLGQDLDIVDFDTATKVSGIKFYYLKNEGVYLEIGLIRYVLDILQKKGFTPYITPDIARNDILEGIGFNPRGAESNVYSLKGEDTCLVGTAEITLGGYYSNTILAKDKLPLRMAGLSHCFRREAGAAGQFSKGLYRVHQFTKMEMFVLCLPEESEQMHMELRSIEEEIFTGLEIPYRIVDTCTGDLGAPAFRKWDLEAWMPGRTGPAEKEGLPEKASLPENADLPEKSDLPEKANVPNRSGGEWGEVTSTSNCTDYQARRLNIRYKDDDGKNKFVHMLNGTAIAISRAFVALLENFQQEDGSVRIPRALVPYVGFDIIRKR
jgi:seryl-tRNA synthetase